MTACRACGLPHRGWISCAKARHDADAVAHAALAAKKRRHKAEHKRARP